MDGYYEPAPFFWIEEGGTQASTPRTRKYIKKKREYVGWGSRELIEFLNSIGKDTSKSLSQGDLTTIVNEYVNLKQLTNPKNKRRILCDEKLQTLFGKKKSVLKNKIYDLLDPHLAENQVGSDDNLWGSSDEYDEETFSITKKQKNSNSEKKPQLKKKAPEVSKNSLAAINAENMKLVFLKRSLVQELQKHPEAFESKVVGSFVRVKSDPHDIFQKNSHQLQLVTGVVVVDGSTLLQISSMTDDIQISELSDENFSEDEIEDLHRRFKDGLLKQPTVGELDQKVTILHEDIIKHWLARELVLLKNLADRANEKGWRYKVAEYLERRNLLESSAEQSRLFSEIPKVIPEEVKLETIAECAPDDSPKAADWDWELYDSPKEDLMNPEVITKHDIQASNRTSGDDDPGNTATEVTTRSNGNARPLVDLNNGHAESFEFKIREAPRIEAIRFTGKSHNPADIPNTDKQQENVGREAITMTSSSHNYASFLNTGQESKYPLQLSNTKESGGATVVIDLSDDDDDDDKDNTPGGGIQVQGNGGIHVQGNGGNQVQWAGGIQAQGIGSIQAQKTGGIQVQGNGGTQVQRIGGIQVQGNSGVQIQQTGGIQVQGNGGIQVQGNSGIPVQRFGGTQAQGNSGIPVQRLGGIQAQGNGGIQVQGPLPEQLVWHYFDPQGRVQGPFSLSSLKRWSDLNYFPADFRVWLIGRSPQDAVPLSLLLQQVFPN